MINVYFATFSVQGRCKPSAMELAPIAEAPPVLAAIGCKGTKNFANKCNYTIK